MKKIILNVWLAVVIGLCGALSFKFIRDGLRRKKEAEYNDKFY